MRIQNVEGSYTIPENLSLHSVRTEGIIVECNTANDPVTITLPPLTAYPNVKNLRVIVVDASGDAETNNITVELAQEEASTTIDGELSWTIDNASDAVVFSRVTEDDWTASKQIVDAPPSIPYKSYVAQVLNNHPSGLTVQIRQNDFQSPVEVSRSAQGTIQIQSMGGEFQDAAIFVSQVGSTNLVTSGQWYSNEYVFVKSQHIDSMELSDTNQNFFVEIRSYN